MLYTYVRLGARANSFSDLRSGIILLNKTTIVKLESFQMNDRVMTALAHSFLVQVTKAEYELIYAPLVGATSEDVISTEVAEGTLDSAKVFNNVIGPIDSPPAGATTGGDYYLIGGTPLLEWKGKNGLIAQWVQGAWEYTTPDDGSIAMLKLYPGYFYFYSGVYPGGLWRKYPSDSVDIPTINDING